MMQSKPYLFAAALALSTSAYAGSDTYTFYDAGSPQSTQLVPNLVAEFAMPNASNQTQARALGESNVRALNASAELTDQGSGAARIWKLNTNTTPTEVQARNTGNSTEGGALSPVFIQRGTLTALAGGVLVEFKANTTEAQVKEWAAVKGYAVKEKMSLANFYVIDTPVGIESLNLANEWQSSGEVVSATPNWWRQRKLK